jgi:hypothetical protein
MDVLSLKQGLGYLAIPRDYGEAARFSCEGVIGFALLEAKGKNAAGALNLL